jgi:protein-disulfide isomerase
MVKKSSLIVLAVSAVLAVATAVLLDTAGPPQAPAQAPQTSPAGEPPALVRFHSPTLGDPAAKVEIVEFFDPACEACRAVYPLVKQVIDSNPGRVRLTIRYTPFHKGADEIVKLLEASGRQGKYWQTLERLLAQQPRWAINHAANLDLALQAVSGLGLDMERLKADMRAPELARLIEQDMNDALAFKVSGTPSFFVNGRLLEAESFDDLKAKLGGAVRAAYP